MAVTGPSASGKTTWCRRHYLDDVVDEYSPTGVEPVDADLAAQAALWCGVSCRRWQEAADRERVSGLAVCDDDPLKLHYSWSLVRIGEASEQLWAHEVAAHRAAIAAGRLGFADVVLVSLRRLTSCTDVAPLTRPAVAATSRCMSGWLSRCGSGTRL